MRKKWWRLTDVVQLLKTAIAGALAWYLAADLWSLSLPFLAPWSAVLVVHATVYRTFTRGVQQVLAVVIAVVLAGVVVHGLGADPLAMGCLLVLAMLVGRLPWLRDESTVVPTTALIALATTAGQDAADLPARLAGTALGVGVGILVNLIIWPPLLDRAAEGRAVDFADRLGPLLQQVAASASAEVDEASAEDWVRAERELQRHLDGTYALVRQAREARTLNPRAWHGLTRVRRSAPPLDPLEDALAELRSLTRTIAISARDQVVWQSDFRHTWPQLLALTGRAVQDADGERLREALSGLRALARDQSTSRLGEHSWLDYGGLILNLRNLVDAMVSVQPWLESRPRGYRRRREAV